MSAVDKLGGPEVGIATPMSILHEMQKLNQHSGRPLNLESLTARRVQSYLQRDRADRLKQPKPAWLYACIATIVAMKKERDVLKTQLTTLEMEYQELKKERHQLKQLSITDSSLLID